MDLKYRLERYCVSPNKYDVYKSLTWQLRIVKLDNRDVIHVLILFVIEIIWIIFMFCPSRCLPLPDIMSSVPLIHKIRAYPHFFNFILAFVALLSLLLLSTLSHYPP